MSDLPAGPLPDETLPPPGNPRNGFVLWPPDWPRYRQACFSNWDDACGMLVGPCGCGAWHGEGEFRLIGGVLHRYGSPPASWCVAPPKAQPDEEQDMNATADDRPAPPDLPCECGHAYRDHLIDVDHPSRPCDFLDCPCADFKPKVAHFGMGILDGGRPDLPPPEREIVESLEDFAGKLERGEPVEAVEVARLPDGSLSRRPVTIGGRSDLPRPQSPAPDLDLARIRRDARALAEARSRAAPDGYFAEFNGHSHDVWNESGVGLVARFFSGLTNDPTGEANAALFVAAANGIPPLVADVADLCDRVERAKLAMGVCMALDAYQRNYAEQARAEGCMPGNEYYSGMMMRIVEMARAALAPRPG